MGRKILFNILLLGVLALSLASCAGSSNYSQATGRNPYMMDCNGDVPSPYPPFCHPIHN
jgi:hypothetical protein